MSTSALITGVCALAALIFGIVGCVTPFATAKNSLGVEFTFKYNQLEICKGSDCLDPAKYTCDSFKSAINATLAFGSLGIIVSAIVIIMAALAKFNVKKFPQNFYLIAMAVGALVFFISWPIAISLFTGKHCDVKIKDDFEGAKIGASPFMLLIAFGATVAGAVLLKVKGNEDADFYHAV